MFIVTDAQVHANICSANIKHVNVDNFIDMLKRNLMIIMSSNGSIVENGNIRLLFNTQHKASVLESFTQLGVIILKDPNSSHYFAPAFDVTGVRLILEFVNDTYAHALSNRCGVINFQPTQIKLLTPFDLFQIKQAQGVKSIAMI